MPAYTPAELMVVTAAREIIDHEVVFVGMRLPLLSFQLANATHAPHATSVFELGAVRDTPAADMIYTMGDLPVAHGAEWLTDNRGRTALVASVRPRRILDRVLVLRPADKGWKVDSHDRPMPMLDPLFMA